MRNLFVGCAIVALASGVASAQETTSSIRGTVSSNGVAVANASVTVVHVPTGSKTTFTTDRDGNYLATGLRAGGPYTVSVSAAGYADAQISDVNTTVAQSFELPVDLQPQGKEIVVSATQVRSARNMAQGPTTALTAARIANIASINRDIRDLEQRDPFARLDDTPGGGRVVSFAGQNARFNRFSVDGVPITDNVGINGDGLPSRRSPIPFDAIAQFQAKVAPYDVREGNFQGGSVNIITKSGTNAFHGTGFYARSGDQFVGDRTGDLPKINTPSFKVENYGAQISGPIIKDRVFFMVAGERLRGGLPLAEGPVDNNVGIAIPGLTQAQVDQIIAIAKSKYSYDPGGVLHESGDKDDRLVAKLDANITDRQHLSLTYTYAKDGINNNQSNTFTTPPPGLGLASNAYVLGNKLQTGVGQLNSQWSDEFSTEVRGFYKEYDRIQTPLLGNNFAQFKVCTAPTSDRFAAANQTSTTEATGCATGVPIVSIGPDNSRQTNILYSSTWGGLVQARLNKNNHDLRVFGEYNYVKVFDAFVQNSSGNYYFDSIADFQSGNAQSLTYGNALSLNPFDAAANFAYQTYDVGIMDTWRISNKLTFSYGARYDLDGLHDTPVSSPAFFNRYGFASNSTIKGRGLFQPRLSFDYKPSHRLVFNGGIGIFGGGTPDIYAANSFQQTGVLSNSVTIREQNNGAFTGGTPLGFSQATGIAALQNVTGTSIPSAVNNYLTASAPANSPANASTVNALDPHFKTPSQWRATLSGTYNANLGPLGDNWQFGADFLWSKVRNQVFFTDLRSIPVAGNLTPDGRQRYTGLVGFNDSNADILLTDTKKGRSYVAVARFEKQWDFGIDFYGSFTYEDVKDQTPATSSVATSNYLNAAYVDPNVAAYGISNDQVRYQFKYGVTYDHAFFGDYKTTIALFGESREGHPYSYTFQDPASGRSAVFGTTGSGTSGTSGSRYLLYVPKVGGDPLVSYDSAATQAAVEAYIKATGLSKYQGTVAPRNAFHSPWFTKLDVHLAQEIPTGFLRSRITLFADIENLTNLINRHWGQDQEYAFPYTSALVRVQCLSAPVATGTAPGTAADTSTTQKCVQYRYSPAITSNGQFVAPQKTVYTRQSLYSIRVGARFTF